MAIQKIDDIYELLKGNTQKKRLVVAYANDSHSIEAVNKAVEMGIVEATLCGDENEIKKVCAELVLKLYTSRWIRKQLPKRYKWYVTRKLTLS